MRRLPLRIVALILLLGCSLPAFPQDEPPPPEPQQREVIRSFDSLIALRSDGTMHVTEIIRVVALNERIKHGIFRDFPTQYLKISGAIAITSLSMWWAPRAMGTTSLTTPRPSTTASASTSAAKT